MSKRIYSSVGKTTFWLMKNYTFQDNVFKQSKENGEMSLLSEWCKPCDNEDLKNKHQAYLALSDRYNGLDKKLFKAHQNK